MGSSVLAHCATRGVRVLGIEQFSRGHALGASSGKTRIIRQAYYEDPAYVPLLLRAYELWNELAQRTGTEVLRITGLLMTGLPESEVIAGSTLSARTYDLPVEYLNAGDIRSRFPMLRVLDGEAGVFERVGGVVFPERAIDAHLRVAEKFGAEMRFETGMRTWNSDGDCVTVQLDDGSSVEASSLVLTTGPWIESEFAKIGIPLEIQRNVQVWFAPATDAYGADKFPVFLLDRASLPAPLYGFPDFGDGVKAAFHSLGELTHAGELRREIDREHDVDPLAAAVNSWMPGAAASYRDAKACMYSLTPDRHFVVDEHPAHGNVVLCGGFSGHGFKFATVIGEVAADLALNGSTDYEISFLSASRLLSGVVSGGESGDEVRDVRRS